MFESGALFLQRSIAIEQGTIVEAAAKDDFFGAARAEPATVPVEDPLAPSLTVADSESLSIDPANCRNGDYGTPTKLLSRSS